MEIPTHAMRLVVEPPITMGKLSHEKRDTESIFRSIVPWIEHDAHWLISSQTDKQKEWAQT